MSNDKFQAMVPVVLILGCVVIQLVALYGRLN